MFKIKNKKLVGIGLLASLLCTNALALENESYIGNVLSHEAKKHFFVF